MRPPPRGGSATTIHFLSSVCAPEGPQSCAPTSQSHFVSGIRTTDQKRPVSNRAMRNLDNVPPSVPSNTSLAFDRCTPCPTKFARPEVCLPPKDRKLSH